MDQKKLLFSGQQMLKDIVKQLNIIKLDALLEAFKKGEKEISPSTLYAVASVLKHCPYANGSP